MTMAAASDSGQLQAHLDGPLHVGMICPRLPAAVGNATGSPAHIRKTQAALERRGHRVSLLQLDLDRGSPLELLQCAARTFRELRGGRPDVLHVHGHLPAALVLAPAAWLGLPWLVELHGLYVPSRPGTPGTRPLRSRVAGALELPVLRRAGAVLVQALAMRDRLLARGVPASRVAVIYPGLATAEFSEYAGPPAQLPNERPGSVAVVYVGLTFAFQGLDLLAAAQRHLPPHFTCVLVTSAGAGAPAEVVARFGFDPARTVVEQPASHAAIPAWCRRADVLVHARPDVPDNVNVQSKLGLYLAAGRPIAATDVGDYPALLGGSRGCVLTPPTPEAFAQGVMAAVRPDVAAAAAAENPSIARRHFEADANAERLVELYRRAMGTGRVRADAGSRETTG